MNRPPRKRRALRWCIALILLLIVAGVCGCRTLKYYGQAIKGQFQIMRERRPIESVIADPGTSPDLRRKLELVQQLRAFAEKDLKLPVDGHYRKYADIHRPYVVWNVQAAPQFSLQPKSWWYPFVGSLEYRGYFSENNAQSYARELWADGFDVYVSGVDAYSTLGWFSDPVLNTFIFRPEAELAEIIFHELGHQRVFAGGDTDFNEAFATTVGQEGARRWLSSRGDTNSFAAYLAALRRNDQFVELIMNTRTNLEKIYGDTRDKNGKIQAAKKPPAAPEELQKEKQRVFDELRRGFAELKSRWNGFPGYDAWFAQEPNNAQLNTVANYHDLVPGFERLLKSEGGDLEKFYKSAEQLSKLSKEDRHKRLRSLAAEVADASRAE